MPRSLFTLLFVIFFVQLNFGSFSWAEDSYMAEVNCREGYSARLYGRTEGVAQTSREEADMWLDQCRQNYERRFGDQSNQQPVVNLPPNDGTPYECSSVDPVKSCEQKYGMFGTELVFECIQRVQGACKNSPPNLHENTLGNCEPDDNVCKKCLRAGNTWNADSGQCIVVGGNDPKPGDSCDDGKGTIGRDGKTCVANKPKPKPGGGGEPVPSPDDCKSGDTSCVRDRVFAQCKAKGISGDTCINRADAVLSECKKMQVPKDQANQPDHLGYKCPEWLVKKVDPIPGNPPSGGWPMDQEIADAKDKCDARKRRADDCCTDPIKCITDGKTKGFSMNDLSMIMGLGGVAAQATSMSDICKLSKDLNKLTAVANAAMAYTCNQKQGKCHESCDGSYRRFKEAYEACEPHKGNQLSSLFGHCSVYSDKYKQVMVQSRQRNEQCEALDTNFYRMSVQAATLMVASVKSQKCESETKPDDINLLSGDNDPCTGADAATNPFCRTQYCSNPANASDPTCSSVAIDDTGLKGNTSAGFGDDRRMKFSKDDMYVPDNNDVHGQQTGFGDYEAENSAPVIAPGGGGMPGGAGGNGGGTMGSTGGGGPSGGKGYKTNTLDGYEGGGGYSVSSMGFNSGGGYSAGGSGYGSKYGGGRAGLGFDLKKYLPGNKKGIPKRGIAGMTGPKDIASASANIFQKISERYFQICRYGRLYDCKQMKKRKPGL